MRDHALLPERLEDIAEHDTNGPGRCARAAGDRRRDVGAADLPQALDPLGDPPVKDGADDLVVTPWSITVTS